MGGTCCKMYPKEEGEDEQMHPKEGDDENSRDGLSMCSERSSRSVLSSVGSSDIPVARLTLMRDETSGVNARVDNGHGRAMSSDKKVNSSIVTHRENYEKQREKREYAMSRQHPGLGRPPNARQGEQIAAGWPSWLAAVASEAIIGWIPRKVESFQKLNKIGQGSYSDVYRALDLEQNKIVALKKLKIRNLDRRTVRFMTREISILRRLRHPNIIKLEGLVTSEAPSKLLLVFEYMEHNLLEISSRPDLKLTEPQIKCYMQQLLHGLDHCHRHDILHRDIKSSNLLVDNNGILKIADFGLATIHNPLTVQRMTSRIVTLWYRPPELLLGATYYGAGVDLWSTGCVLAELYAGRPIMTGKTEVDQLHKIFRLCGTPSEDYWDNPKLPNPLSFKPKQTYKRCIAEIFKDIPSPALALVETLLSINPPDRQSASYALKSEFFRSDPLPCQPSELPRFRPREELDLKERYEDPSSQGSGVRGPTNPRAITTRDDNVLSMQKRTGMSNSRTSKINLDRSLTAEDQKGKTIGMIRGSINKDFDYVREHVDSRHKKIISGFPKGDWRNSSSNNSNNNKDPMNLRYSSEGKNIRHSRPLVTPVSKVDQLIRDHDRNLRDEIRHKRPEEANYKEGGIVFPTNYLFVGGRWPA